MSSIVQCALLFHGDLNYPDFTDEERGPHTYQKTSSGPYHCSVTRFFPFCMQASQWQTWGVKWGDGAKTWGKMDVFKIWASGREKEHSSLVSWWKYIIYNPPACFSHLSVVYYGKVKEKDDLEVPEALQDNSEGMRKESPLYWQLPGVGDESLFLPGYKSGSWAREGSQSHSWSLYARLSPGKLSWATISLTQMP